MRMAELGTEVSAAHSGTRRGKYARENTTDPSFSLATHLTKTLGVAAAICAFGVWLARDATVWHWAAFPLFWIVANFFEWAMHRFPMHHPLQPRILYTNHALVHHYGFQGADQEIRGTVELSVVMMPWYTLTSSSQAMRFDTQAIGGIGWPVGRSWQLSLGLQAGVRVGYAGGRVSYQEGRYAFTYDNWGARFSSQAILGYRHNLSDSFGLTAQLAFPLTNMIGELFDGDTGLLSFGVVWRPGA